MYISYPETDSDLISLKFHSLDLLAQANEAKRWSRLNNYVLDIRAPPKPQVRMIRHRYDDVDHGSVGYLQLGCLVPLVGTCDSAIA